MIDPRYANVGAVPLTAGYGGAQQMPMQYHYHHHRHHGHHKHQNRHDESPISRDESIHKVDHGQAHNYHQNIGAPFGTGYGVPYNAGGYGNQYQGDSFGQGHSGVNTVKHRRRHHRHNRHHTVEAGNTGGDRGQGVPEQLIGQRSSSVLSNQGHDARSPAQVSEGDLGGEQQQQQQKQHRSRRSHYQGSENASFGQAHQSHQAQGHTSVGADGYGHINEDLIFIERGEHSPHRQEPPPGYEYKGKIEVQGVDKERSRSRGHDITAQPYAPTYPTTQPNVSSYSTTQATGQVSSGPCPPGWQQMVLSATGGAPCASGGVSYSGQIVGATGSTGGYGSYGGSYPATSGYRYSSDYNAGYQQSGYQQTGASGFNPCFSVGGYSQTGTTGPTTTSGYTGQYQKEHVHEQAGRPTIIEVWQKRQKGTTERPGSRTEGGPQFDFEKFRNEILAAIGRIPRGEGGRESHTQTQIQPSGGGSNISSGKEGEVRVIVQPIQPVFYMPRQSETGSTAAPQILPSGGISSGGGGGGAPNVVYVPRNVYVPVIKPVFVPRERVIIRPQVVHVARPVLVDRPVPVTQRPIIIDRERPIPVPVRGQGAAQGGGSRIVKEEFVYRDNLPVAYGGRCAEFTGGSNLGYVRSEQHQTQATHQTYQPQEAFQTHQAHEAYQTQQGGQIHQTQAAHQAYQPQEAFQTHQAHEAYQTQQGGQIHQGYQTHEAQQTQTTSGRIEVLDAAVNPNWIRTDQSSLQRRYGQPAVDIVHRSEQVEQQMYSELRQRTSSGGIARSASSASYASGSGIDISGGGAGAGVGNYAQF